MAKGASYTIKLCDDAENTIQIFDPGVINFLEWRLVENDTGALRAVFPQIWEWDLFQPYRTILLERRIEGGIASVVENRRWFLLDWAFYTDENGNDYTEIIAYDSNILLDGRVVAYEEKTSQSDKTDQYDDICKLVVTENMVSATDSARNITGISVAAGTGGAPSGTVTLAYKKLLDVCRDAANASWAAGTYLAFDMVNTGAGTFRMETYIGQRGDDHTADSGDPRVVQLKNARLEYRTSESANYVYCGKPVQTASNTTWAASSKFARREAYASSNPDNAAAGALAELQNLRPRLVLTGTIEETDGLMYGIDYKWGDILSAQYNGKAIDCRVSMVGATYEGGKETMEIGVRGEL